MCSLSQPQSPSRLGQLRLLKQAIIHTNYRSLHRQPAFFTLIILGLVPCIIIVILYVITVLV